MPNYVVDNLFMNKQKMSLFPILKKIYINNLCFINVRLNINSLQSNILTKI